jgi:hypothetical protein
LPLIGEQLKAKLEKAGARLERGKAGRPAHEAPRDTSCVPSMEFD